MSEHSSEVTAKQLADCRLPSIGKATAWLAGLAVLGIIAAVVNCQFVDHAARRFWQAYLVAFALVLSITLGSMFFVLIQHLTRAGWSVAVRRWAEILCLNILVVGLLFLPIAWSVWQADGLIYRWSKTDSVAAESDPRLEPDWNQGVSLVSNFQETPLGTGQQEQAAEGHSAEQQVAHKPFLDNSRFLLSWIVLFVVWAGIALFYFRTSVAQDTTRDLNLTLKMEWWSGIATLLFAYSLTFAAFDLLMTLDPTWYSTIFGVYFFAGSVVAGLASLLLVVLLLKRQERVPAVFSDELQRDLGRLLFTFVFFWAYIGFSQYMLLWYANMPETTGWLVKRGMSTATGYTNSWGWLAILLLVAHFIVPFGGLMSKHVKSNSRAMIFWTLWLLLIHYLDLYWIVIPEYNDELTVSFIELGIAVAVVAVYGISALWIASRTCLFAVGDPRLQESLTRHPAY